jgi:hypothetical protein
VKGRSLARFGHDVLSHHAGHPEGQVLGWMRVDADGLAIAIFELCRCLITERWKDMNEEADKEGEREQEGRNERRERKRGERS